MDSALIRDIDVEKEESWDQKLFITVDMEWASDESVKYLLDKIAASHAKVTIFCTHSTPLIEDLRHEPWVELGIHPNFNFLFEGDFRYGKSIDEVVAYYKQIIPESCSVRSHCHSSGTVFSRAFLKNGLKFDCSEILPSHAGLGNRPWRSYVHGIVSVPVFWQDDVHCVQQGPFDISRLLMQKGLKVFNFHPVTVALNIISMELYDLNKPAYSDHEVLLRNRNRDRGVDDFLEELLNAAC